MERETEEIGCAWEGGKKELGGWGINLDEPIQYPGPSVNTPELSGGQSQQRLHPHSPCPQSTKQWQFSLAFAFNLFFTSQEESLEGDWNCYFILPLLSILIWAWFSSFLSLGLVLSIAVLEPDSFSTGLGVSPPPHTVQEAFKVIPEWLHFHVDTGISFSL